MKRKFIPIILLIAICLGMQCMAEGSEASFSIADGLSFSSTPEEAVEWLGEGADLQRYDDEDVGKLAIVIKDDFEYSGLQCGRIGLMYYNDTLVYSTLYFTKDSLQGDEETLIDVLIARLGDPETFDDGHYDNLDDLFGAAKTLCQWLPNEQTRVTVERWSTEEEYPWFCSVTFDNLPALEALQAAVEVE